MSTSLRRFGRVLRIIVVIELALAAALLAGVALLGRSPGGTLLHPVVDMVRSGSMTPTFRAGDLVVDRPVTPAQAEHLGVGQIITFVSRSGVTFTHRIVGVTPAGYRTRGDANNVADPGIVPASQVRGLFERRVPYLGYAVSFLHTRDGVLLLVTLPVAVVVMLEVAQVLGRPGEVPAPEGATAPGARPAGGEVLVAGAPIE